MTDIQTWPLNIDFTIAVQNPQLCFADADLKQANTTKNSRGRVLLWSGNFATVYKLTKGDRAWAVRCFTRVPQSDVQQRYQLISDYLSQHPIPYLVNFEFLAQGILVKGEWYPILKMDWVEGTELDRYIGEYIDDSQILLRLERQLHQLQKDLQKVGIAHGDLQHGNIMVDEHGELKLVDYDGMYVPALRGTPPLEVGHPNYQPPKRSPEDFSDQLDEFSFEVISLSLRALATEPNLWATFHEDNKNLIFRQNDFEQPESSPVFQAIANIPDDETRALCDRLIRRCHGKDQKNADPQANFSPTPKFFNFPNLAPQQTLILISVIALALGAAFLWTRRSPSNPIITIPTSIPVPISPKPSPTNSPTNSAKPSNSPAPVPSSPKLTPMNVATFQTKYAEGQRDFRYIQLTGNAGDRLQGQDFSNIDLSGSVIEKLDLRQVILRKANLDNAKLNKIDLRGADLSNASLIEADLSLSNLAEANLTQAKLLRSNLSQVKLGSAILQKADLMKSNLSEADLNAANLNGAILVLTNLRKANLTKANLRESNLAAANLSDAILDGADLTASDLRSAELHLTNLSNANLSGSNLTSAKLILIEFAGTNLSGANFRNASIENIGSIESADFSNALNLAPNLRKYFCSLASGTITESGSATKSTLNCN
ncbi:pentapeptide repeat-containing protein [Pseudanabaena sp. FACHB-1998]|uniref:pentapeptide repeat-containing protein n=1 Tax=Pseudanabaena sp. FACHB-1998 TaxID=2692858 RepID=UPI0016819403|nr:pentapeptide repeat-containing protein [Pseudanabaena sp. FACHB-1998]MBD2177045.1 pentapeptide repeat-containing protein [Pseudanabaena sp. FACHB-1998]